MSTHSEILRAAKYRSQPKSGRWPLGRSALLVGVLSLVLWAGIIWAVARIF